MEALTITRIPNPDGLTAHCRLVLAELARAAVHHEALEVTVRTLNPRSFTTTLRALAIRDGAPIRVSQVSERRFKVWRPETTNTNGTPEAEPPTPGGDRTATSEAVDYRRTPEFRRAIRLGLRRWWKGLTPKEQHEINRARGRRFGQARLAAAGKRVRRSDIIGGRG